MNTETYRKWMKQWNLDAILPKRIGDFVRGSVTLKEEERRVFFHYEDVEKNWKIEGFFQEETQDFVVKYDIGVAIWTELRFLLGDGEMFGKALKAEFAERVTSRLVDPKRHLPRAVADLRLETYDWDELMPLECGIFRLKVHPYAPIEGLNGSYLVGLYADAENNYGVLLFYNTFRNEFFAEICNHRVPGMIHDLDAAHVEGWRQVLKERLPMVMERLLTT